jgi:hypothetical protein
LAPKNHHLLRAQATTYCVVVWRPSHHYFVRWFGPQPTICFVWWFGLGAKPQLFVLLFGSQATTICVVVWEHEHSGGFAICGGFQQIVVAREQPQKMGWHLKI